MASKSGFKVFKSTERASNDEGFGKFGVCENNPTGAVLYEAMFSEVIATRLCQLENSATPPEDWEAARAILEQEGLVHEDDDGTTEAYREGRQLATKHIAAGGDLHAPGPGPGRGKFTETQEERYNGFIERLAEERRKQPA